MRLSTPEAPQKKALQPMGQPMAQPQTASQGGPQQQPAPTHSQTVAALRHLSAIQSELTKLLENPNLGKADMKSAIIDGVTKLVADRIVPATAAVAKLAMVPDRPFEQKKWIEQDYVQNEQARNLVLDHHRASAVGTENYELENKLHDSDPENHMQDISAMMQSNYKGA